MKLEKGWTKNVLNNGYLKLVDWMGSDETIVEAARMSTGKGFFGWFWDKDTYADSVCTSCLTQHLVETLPWTQSDNPEAPDEPLCTNCWKNTVRRIGQAEAKLLGRAGEPRDLSLLEFLMSNRHSTPFEMGDICVEVKAPIMVFREWHRHRMQSYNEFSARYSQMPNDHYLPELARIQKQSKSNKQGSAGAVDHEQAAQIVSELERQQEEVYGTYEAWVGNGIAKEIARLNTPVSRFSKMRAKTDLRNWLGFLSLRMELSAQWEIQQYALAVAEVVHALFPRSYELFLEHEFLAVRFSRSEMRVIRELAARGLDLYEGKIPGVEQLDPKKSKTFLSKLTDDRESQYSHVPGARK